MTIPARIETYLKQDTTVFALLLRVNLDSSRSDFLI